MTRLEKAILQVKESRLHENRPWIYDENGEIKEEAICGEALCLLEEMKDYEVSVDDDFVGELLSDIDGVGDNTYNYNAKTNILCKIQHLAQPKIADYRHRNLTQCKQSGNNRSVYNFKSQKVRI